MALYGLIKQLSINIWSNLTLGQNNLTVIDHYLLLTVNQIFLKLYQFMNFIMFMTHYSRHMVSGKCCMIQQYLSDINKHIDAINIPLAFESIPFLR